jgi:hypothetical protein
LGATLLLVLTLLFEVGRLGPGSLGLEVVPENAFDLGDPLRHEGGEPQGAPWQAADAAAVPLHAQPAQGVEHLPHLGAQAPGKLAGVDQSPSCLRGLRSLRGLAALDAGLHGGAMLLKAFRGEQKPAAGASGLPGWPSGVRDDGAIFDGALEFARLYPQHGRELIWVQHGAQPFPRQLSPGVFFCSICWVRLR